MKGKHLIVDGKIKRDFTNSRIKELFEKICKAINVRMISDLLILKGTDYNPGITGIVVIEFSHIALHTFTKTNRFCLDIFCCKNFNEGEVLKVLKKFEEIEDFEVKTFEREV